MDDNIPAVAESARDERDQSIRCRSQQLDLSCGTIRRILRNGLIF